MDLVLRDNHSLKEKRRVLKSIIGRVKSKFNVSIAEVGNQDLWQSAQIGFCIAGNEKRFVNSSLDKVIYFIEENCNAEINHAEMEIITF